MNKYPSGTLGYLLEDGYKIALHCEAPGCRDIEGIECSEEFYRLNFEPIEYEDSRGRLQPMFRMSRDGFSLLVMGFTGTKAMLWKERYIEAFNMMEAELSHMSVGVQLADMVAGAIGRKFNVGDDKYFQTLTGSFRASPSGNIEGFGLVKFPKSTWR